ncbi:MAG: alpha-2-macroglobulin family protein, partial [Myxococcota bacterium]|nr:alpha-2-macroglobulin family protein [Myxococcota bacterium]
SLSAVVEPERSTLWLSRLDSGLAVPLAEIQGLDDEGKLVTLGKTDAQGFLTLEKLPQALVARGDDDVLLLPTELLPRVNREVDAYFAWHVVDDRSLYRPGEKVQAKGWVRELGMQRGGDVSGVSATQVSYRFLDARGIELDSGQVPLGEHDDFTMSTTLPDSLNLGSATLELSLEGETGAGAWHSHSFLVEEFRRPEFELEVGGAGPYFVGETIVGLAARYYSGGPLTHADSTWHVSAQLSAYVPPGLSAYSFGNALPEWLGVQASSPSAIQSREGKTGADGMHYQQVEFAQPPTRPVLFTVEASVADRNAQRFSTTGSFVVHPASLYLGLKPEQLFVRAGESFNVDVLLSDLEGGCVSGQSFELVAARLERHPETAAPILVEPQRCAASSEDGAVRCRFGTQEAGTYVLTGSAWDERERLVQTRVAVFVAGESPALLAPGHEAVLLLADADSYRSGEKATVLIQSPWEKAQGVLTVRRSGVVERRLISIEDYAAQVELELLDAWVPGVGVQVDLVSVAARLRQGEWLEELPWRPAFASGYLRLGVEGNARRLVVEAKAAKDVLQPGEDTELELRVFDPEGQAVSGADLTVAVIDEAVLALSGYELAEPLHSFLLERNDDSESFSLRERLEIRDCDAIDRTALVAPRRNPAPAVPGFGNRRLNDELVVREVYQLETTSERHTTSESGRLPAPSPADSVKMPDAAAAVEPSASAAPIATRSDFEALVTFVASARSDAEGRLRLPVHMPDSLTRYRIIAVAAAGERYFGSAEGTLTVQRNLMLRPSLPRFAQVEDRFEVPVVVQNLSDVAQTVSLAARASNADFENTHGYRFEVPPNDRVQLLLPVQTRLPGRAQFQFVAVAGGLSDASSQTIPVRTPASTEAFAVYGVIDEGMAVQTVLPPMNASAEYGGLELSTSSTAVAALTDAVLYFVDYPFDQSEAMASRVLAISALRPVLEAFSEGVLPGREALEARVAEELEELARRQLGDGGFAWWSDYSEPFLSVHVAHALCRAQAAGFAVPERALQRSMQYLQEIEGRIAAFEARYHGMGEGRRRAIISYAAYVRAVIGEDTSELVLGLIAGGSLERFELDALGWCLSVLGRSPRREEAALAEVLGEGQRLLSMRVEETASSAHFVSAWEGSQEDLLLRSAQRTDAILLEALLSMGVEEELLPKLVHGLLAHRRKGHWRNPQENVWALLALSHYFARYEAVEPRFVARVWLDELYGGEQSFQGRSAERQELRLPMSVLLEKPEKRQLLVAKEGEGRLYYRLGLRYAPKDLSLEALERGLMVSRSYEAQPEAGLYQDQEGVWHVKLGSTVRVRVKVSTQSR